MYFNPINGAIAYDGLASFLNYALRNSLSLNELRRRGGATFVTR